MVMTGKGKTGIYAVLVIWTGNRVYQSFRGFSIEIEDDLTLSTSTLFSASSYVVEVGTLKEMFLATLSCEAF